MAASAAFAGTTVDPSLSALGARSLGMGSISTTLLDANAVFTNPAGIGYIRDWQLSATSNTVLNDINQNIAFGAYKTPWGTIGLGYVDITMAGSFATMRDPSNLGRIILNPSVEVTSYENSVTVLSYAKRFNFSGNDISLGLNFKSYTQSISGSSETSSRGTATNIDLGVLYTPAALPWLTAGASYKNAMASNLQWTGASSAQDSLGGTTTIGLSGNILGSNALRQYGDQNLLAAVDFEIPRSVLSSSNSSLMHLGAEWKPIKELSVRAGFDQRSSSTNLNYGIGLERGGFRFDYAYKGNSVSEAVSHVFTLSYAPEPIEKPKPPVFREPYILEISSPADKSTTTSEAILISGKIKNAALIAGLKINGRLAMPFITANSFEVYWYPLKEDANALLIEAFVSSPEAGSAKTRLDILKTSPIKDIEQVYFAKDPINYLQKLSIMKGYDDGSFKPNNPITRAELVTLLVKAKGLTAEAAENTDFKDLPKTFWATKFAVIAIKENIASGYPDKTFKPQKNVSRAESAVIFSRFAALSFTTPEYSPYTDISKTNWAAGNIISAKKAGFLAFITTPSFEAGRNITRGEVAYMLSRTKIVSDAIKKLFGAETTTEATAATGEAAAKIIKPSAATLEAGAAAKESLPSSEEAFLGILPPPQSIETKYNSIIVTGTVLSQEAKYVLVNSLKTELSKTMRAFSKTIALASGENTIEIIALNKDAKTLAAVSYKIRKYNPWAFLKLMKPTGR